MLAEQEKKRDCEGQIAHVRALRGGLAHVRVHACCYHVVQDFQGQELADKLGTRLLAGGAVVGVAAGYVKQDLVLVLYIFLAAVAVTCAVCGGLCDRFSVISI